MNRVCITGKLGRDPEIRYTPGGTAVSDISVAVSERIKTGDQWKDAVVWVDVTVWGSTCEFVGKYAVKGTTVEVDGKLQMDSWEDKQSGQKRTKLKVKAESVKLLSSRGSEDQRPANDNYGEESQVRTGGGSIDESEVPF